MTLEVLVTKFSNLIERQRRPDASEIKRYTESYNFFKSLLSRVRQAYFPDDGPAQINHKGLKGLEGYRPDLQGQQGFRRADEYLLEAGVSQETIDKIYTQDGRLREVKDNGINPFDFNNPDIAAVYIACQEMPSDEILQKSVDASLPYKFNRHRLDHRADVYHESQWHLKNAEPFRCDIDTTSYILGAESAISHDYGIRESRGLHSLLSVLDIQHDNPGIEKDPRFPRFALDIIAHDPPRLKELLSYFGGSKVDGEFDPDKAVILMNQLIPPEGLALIAADRGQFGERRVPEGIDNVEAFEKDKNIFPNMVWEASPSIQDKTFIQTMYFNPFIDPRGIYGWAGKDSKRAPFIGRKRIHVPYHMHEALKQHETPYSITAEKDWMSMFGKDFLTIQIAAVFALNPHLDIFKLVIKDPFMPSRISKNGILTERIHTFRRGHIQEDLDKYKEQLFIQDKKAA